MPYMGGCPLKCRPNSFTTNRLSLRLPCNGDGVLIILYHKPTKYDLPSDRVEKLIDIEPC
jgi:hypothetical protein